jgi:hypothetical protein
MADTLALTLTCQITEGTSTQTDKRTFTATDVAITEDTDQKFTIAAGVTDLQIALGEVAILEHFVIGFSSAVTVRLNSNVGTQITIAAGGFLCLSGANITSIFVTNAGASAVTATLIGGYST